jgi:peptide/nickel transport system substrate-binding protein
MFERRRKLRVAGVAAVAATAMLAAGCGSSGSSTKPTTTTVKGAVATVANINGSGANWIFPFASTSYYSVTNYEDFMYLMDRPLYMFGGNNTSIAVNYPLSLANAPVYSDGGKTVVVNLKGWKWSNGETVDAKSVIFWLNMDEAEKATFAGYAPTLLPDNLASYSATGPNQVTLHLKQAYGSYFFTYNQLAEVNPFPQAWDITALGAAPGSGGCTTDTAADGWAKCKAVYTFLTAQSKDTSSYVTSPIWSVVNGPFKLSAFNINGNYTFVPNTKYSGSPQASLAQLKFVSYTTTDTAYTALKTGALSTAGIPPADLQPPPAGQALPAVNPLQAQGYSLQAAYQFAIGYANVNFNNPVYGPVFKQLYFRQALQMLDDQAGMAKAVFTGYGYPTTSGVPNQPPSQWVSSDMTANNNSGPYPFDKAKAEALLASHGWTKVGGVLECTSPGTGASQCGAGIAKNLPAKFAMAYSSGATTQAQTVDVLKSDWASAGIQLQTQAETFNSLLADLTPCHGAKCTWTFLYLGGWLFNGPGFMPTGEPLFATGASSNSGGYTDPKMDSLINQTHTSSDISVFHTYADYTATQLPDLWMPWSYGVQAVSNNLHNVTQNPLLTFFPEYWTCSAKNC